MDQTSAFADRRFDPAGCDADALALEGIHLPARLHRAAPRRRQHWLHGRAAVTAAQLRLGLAPIVPDTGLAGEPLWPAEMVGAITHSADYAAAIVALAECWRATGIDAEHVPARFKPAVAERVCAPGEIEMLGRSAALDEKTAFTLGFSARESLYKALYAEVGHFFGFDAARLVAAGAGFFVLQATRDLGPWSAGSEFAGEWTLDETRLLTRLLVRA